MNLVFLLLHEMKAVVKKCVRFYKELYAISTEVAEDKYNFNTKDKKETRYL